MVKVLSFLSSNLSSEKKVSFIYPVIILLESYVILLNMQEIHIFLNLPRHGSMCLNRKCVCLNVSQFTIIDRVLSMSNTIHSARSLYKLMSSYWELSVIRTLSKISKIERFRKIIIAFNCFHKLLYPECSLSWKFIVSVGF